MRDKVKAKRERIWKKHGQWFAPTETDYHLNLYRTLKGGKEHNMATDFTDESRYGLAHEMPHKLEMLFRFGDSCGDETGRFVIERYDDGDLVRMRYL